MSTQFLIAFAVVFAGALVQGCIGFGLALVAAPVLMLVDPFYVPAPLLLAAFVLTLMMSVRERKQVVWSALTWAVAGRIAGSAAAAALVATLPEKHLALLFGILVLLGVALSSLGLTVTPTNRTLLGASVLSGLIGTITAAGGPPMALLYQRASGPQLRGMLSAFFLTGTIISLAMLRAAGRFGGNELKAGLLLAPAAMLGFLVSGRLRRWVDGKALRPLVLTFSGVSALAVIIRSLMT
ncbi:MAG: permease [Armatimonadota bacterium]|nr:MAG: permease [Armatimonadota bacterium]